MSKSFPTHHFFLLVVILCSISGRLLGEKYESEEYDQCENPDFVFPWGNDYLSACLGFQCHRVRQHKSWFRFWDKRPKYLHKNINGNEQVIQCSDCKGFLKKGTLFGGMSVCTPAEFGGDFDTPKGWVSIATASLQINKEIKSKSSIKLVPDNWRIDGETSNSALDLSKCSISEEGSAVALSIIVTLSNIADPSKKPPKYRRILGLSDDSINVRIKTLGQNTGDSVGNGPNGDFDDFDDDDDDYEDYGHEGEGPQQGMDQDDAAHEYILYDMNKMASANNGVPGVRAHKRLADKKQKTRRRKPFAEVENLPRKWKLSKGQASIYSSSDVVRLDLAQDLHPNELVEAVLTCNNKYMNCNIQQFVSCFNILCKAVTKEELIHRAALKKARQFVLDSIITGKTKPIVGSYGSMQFQQGFPPVGGGGVIDMHVQQQPVAGNIVNINSIQTSSVSQFQGVVPVGVVGAIKGSEIGGVQRSDTNASMTLAGSGLQTGVPAVPGGAGGAGVGVGAPRMVFVNSGPQNVNLHANAGAPRVIGLPVHPQVHNVVAAASQNLTLPKSGPQLNTVPGQPQMNIRCQGVQNLVYLNATATAVPEPRIVVSGQQEGPARSGVIILKKGGNVQTQPDASQAHLEATQYILNPIPAQIRVAEHPSAPATKTTRYIVKGLNTQVDQTPVRYKLVLNPNPTTMTMTKTTYSQVVQPQIATESADQPQIIKIQLKEPPALDPVKAVPKEPDTIKLNIVQPAATSTPSPVKLRLVKVDMPAQRRRTFRIVPQEDGSQARPVAGPTATILVNDNLNIRSEGKADPLEYRCHPPAEKVLRLEKVRAAPPEPRARGGFVEVPRKTGKTLKLVEKSVPGSEVRTAVIRKARTRGDSAKKVYKLVPVDNLPRSRRVIVTDSSLRSRDLSGDGGLHPGHATSSADKILVGRQCGKPLNRIEIVRPDSKTRCIYIPSKSSLKVGEIAKKPKNVLLLAGQGPDSFTDNEFETSDEDYSSDSDECSTLILKKVQRKKDPEKLVEIEAGSDSKPVGAQTRKDNIAANDDGRDVAGERNKPEDKEIESNDSGAELGHSSLSDSSVYETSSQRKSYNEVGSTGKSILGYSILASVFLFTIFIIMKLFLL